jgi:stage II sporulation protein AA (anti-sigma F factor antagonist)
MTIQEHFVSDAAVIRISGRVTLTDGTTVFDDTLQRLIGQGYNKLVLDLGAVPYIDSTALGIILRAHATVTRRGGSVKLLNIRGHVRELFELTRLLTVIDAFDSEADALASMEAAPNKSEV